MQAVSAIVAAPAPRLLLWELPMWLVLLFCAGVPGSLSPWWEIAGIPVRSTEAAVAIAAFGYALVGFRTIGWMAAPLICAIAYAAVSMRWSPLEGDDAVAMGITLVFAVAAPVLAVEVLHVLNGEDADHLLWRLTIFLALVSVVYAAESIFALGFRTELGQNTLASFGIERVRGPLYGSSTGYLILLPALAFAIQRTIDVPARRGFGFFLVAALMTALLGLGSRAAILLLMVYFLMLSLLIKNVRKRLAAMLLLVVLAGFAAALVFWKANTERLQSFEDNSRHATHRTAWQMMASQGWIETLRGAGYGAVWNWYLTDARNGERLATGDNMIRTPSGMSLYHSHSTVLEMVVELGAVGAVAFLTMAGLVSRQVIRSWRDGRLQALTCGIAVSFGGLFFDLFLFKNTTVNLIWWFYVLATPVLLRRTA